MCSSVIGYFRPYPGRGFSENSDPGENSFETFSRSRTAPGMMRAPVRLTPFACAKNEAGNYIASRFLEGRQIYDGKDPERFSIFIFFARRSIPSDFRVFLALRCRLQIQDENPGEWKKYGYLSVYIILHIYIEKMCNICDGSRYRT